MKIRVFGFAVLCCALGLLASFPASRTSQSQTTKGLPGNNLSPVEQDLLTEINLARAHPDTYASYLEKMKPFFSGKDYKPADQGGYKTQEGWSAVEEAIKTLRAAKPQDPLNPSNGLRLAAQAHCADQARSGTTGHTGGGGFIEERVKPFGTWRGGIGENLTYGDESARERVLLWLIDDGFASRGHRTRLLSGDYKVAGVACAVHPEFSKMCVLDLAGGFVDSLAARPAGNTETKSTGVASKTNTPAKAATGSTTRTNKSRTTSKPRYRKV